MNIRPCSWSSSVTAEKEGSPEPGWGRSWGWRPLFILDDLLSQGLIYCDPCRELNFWRPTPSALLALGLRSHTDNRSAPNARRSRRGTLGEFALEEDGPHLKTIPTEESGSDLFRSDGPDAAALSRQVESSQSVVDGCPAQGGAVGSGEKES